MTQPTDRAASTYRAQVLNLIDFLSAYDAQRNPPIRKIEDHGMFRLAGTSLPDHPAVRVRPTDETWLAVDFIDLPPVPEPAPAITELLADQTRITAEADPQLIPSPTPPTTRDGQQEPTAEQTRAAEQARQEWQQRTQPAQDWIETIWRPWSEHWKTAHAVKQLHRNLFEQRERLAIDRDAVELVWGFGRLRWTDGTGDKHTSVDHPLLTVPVEIDAVQGSEHLQVRPAGPLEVEGRPLIGLDVHDRSGYSVIRQTVAGDPIDPWLESDRDDLLRRLVRAVDDEGSLVEIGAARSEHATVDTGWTLFLRRKVPDSEGFLQAMRELYRRGPRIDPAAAAIDADHRGTDHNRRGGRRVRGLIGTGRPAAAAARRQRAATADPAAGAASPRCRRPGPAGNREVAHHRQPHQPLRRLRQAGAGGRREGAGAQGSGRQGARGHP